MLASESVDNMITEQYASCMPYVRQENLTHRKTDIFSVRVPEIMSSSIGDLVSKLSIYDKSEVLREILQRGIDSLESEFSETEANRR